MESGEYLWETVHHVRYTLKYLPLSIPDVVMNLYSFNCANIVIDNCNQWHAFCILSLSAIILIAHFHITVQCTLEDRHIHKYQGPVFHHSYSSLSHSLECEDKWKRAKMYKIVYCVLLLKFHLLSNPQLLRNTYVYNGSMFLPEGLCQLFTSIKSINATMSHCCMMKPYIKGKRWSI